MNKLVAKTDETNAAIARQMLDNPIAYQGIQLVWAERVLAKSKREIAK